LLSASASVTITTTRAQTIDGFGTSLGDLYSTSLVKSAKFQKMYYQDLGSSIFRVALNPWVLKGNGSMGTAVNLGPTLQQNINKMNFLDSNILRYGIMARASLKYAKNVKIIGSIWSPPYWMKGPEVSSATGKPNGVKPAFNDKSANTSGGSLVITDANLTQFGRYVAAYVKGFEQAYGVKMYAISIQNELAFHEYYSSCVYSPKEYVYAVKAVSRWFRKYGIDTKIIGPEDVGVGSTTDRGIVERQMSYIKAVRQDPEAMAAVSDWAIHGYANDGVTSQRSPEMWDEYWNGHQGSSSYTTWTGIKTDGKSSWMTETSGFSNSWSSAMRLAGGIQDALVMGNTSGYVYWGFANSGSTASVQALTTNTNAEAKPYTVFKHFSQMIRPGMVRLKTSGVDPTGVYASAFTDDAAKSLTTVLANESNQTQTVTLRLPGIALQAFTKNYESTASFSWRKLRVITSKKGEVVISMPPLSIFTLEGSIGVPQKPGAISGTYFNDANGDKKQESGEAGIGGDKIFIDANNNGTLDRGESYAIANAKGAFTIPNLAPGTYTVRRVAPPGYALTTGASLTVTVKANLTTSGLLIGLRKSGFPSGGGTGRTGSIQGRVFGDTNADGHLDAGEIGAAGKVVFLDTNNNGTLDAGETSTTTDSTGNFSFTGLSAGTYHVRRVFPSGYTYSTTLINEVLTDGEHATGLLIGSKTT